VLLDGDARRELSGAAVNTTNQRMELFSAIQAMRAVTDACGVLIHMDSLYVLNAFRKGWLATWERNGWQNAAKKPVANQDLWRDLRDVAAWHDVEWRWVKGHGEDAEHNRCDELAVEARKRFAAGIPLG
jgi:ribonuclease HI